MSYNDELTSNNADLQAILETVNALPEAGSGGSGGGVETCAVEITVRRADDAKAHVHVSYSGVGSTENIVPNDTLIMTYENTVELKTIYAVKGTSIFFTDYTEIDRTSYLDDVLCDDASPNLGIRAGFGFVVPNLDSTSFECITYGV